MDQDLIWYYKKILNYQRSRERELLDKWLYGDSYRRMNQRFEKHS